MTPEKFQLLRDWVRAEIKSVIIEESNKDTTNYWKGKNTDTDALMESERSFLRVVQAFCGGQVIL
jgi:hypothetical protein|tara:strand:+ start:354 stop:548 length:195 start_codon:yes stop_codon:yes gene_type:complete